MENAGEKKLKEQQKIKRILSECKPPDHPMAEPLRAYLTRRGLNPTLPSLKNIGFHPALGYFEAIGDSIKCIDYLPALIASVTGINGEITGIQRIYLSQSGEKANVLDPKKVLGSIAGGGVYLCELTDTLCVTEGIETGLAVYQATGKPVIAAVSAQGLEHLEIPPRIKAVHIFGDLDKSGIGQKAAETLAHRLHQEKKQCYIHLPQRPILDHAKSIDWLDIFNTDGPETILREYREGCRYPPPQHDHNIMRIADVVEEPARSLWYPYLPLAKTTLVEGDPGVGKSWLTMAIAAAVSKGKGLPNWPETNPRNVLIFSSEDGIQDTIKPRLKVMGANEERIFAYENPIVLDGKGLQTLENAIIRTQPVLIIFDPLTAYLGSQVDMNKANQVRPFMAHLAALASQYDCSILIVRHLTKGGRDKAIYRGNGSVDFTAASRSVLLIGCDPNDKSKRAMVHIKSNLAPFGDSQGYKIEQGQFFWTGKSDLTAERILSSESNDEKENTSAVEDAVNFIKDSLTLGCQPAAEVIAGGRDLGISQRTLSRAKKILGIESFKESRTSNGRWMWRLPETICDGPSLIQPCQEGQGGQPSTMEPLAIFPEEGLL